MIRGNYPKKGRIQVLDTGILVRLPMSKTIRYRLAITERLLQANEEVPREELLTWAKNSGIINDGDVPTE